MNQKPQPVTPSVGDIPESAPGGEAFDADLRQRLADALARRGPGYQPRTRHLLADGKPKYTNRLILESSPYLLQHAHNPVNWYAWGPDAFEAAKRRGCPIFLSVGYSTCHWCHVMEEESFEDVSIASYLNENYVAIKVDREERPDVDAIYMAAVQVLNQGGGGWPMSVWMTAEGKPFFGGTYFPARDGDRGASRGFLTILRLLHDAFHTDAGSVEHNTNQILQAVQEHLRPESGGALPAVGVLHEAERFYEGRFDRTYGGIQGAPKFPSSLSVRFLLRYQRRSGKKDPLEMSSATLEKMAGGGIYDQVGGGFHRYATDRRWLVPHFEKMLYDNALLTFAYLDGYQATGREDFARIAREILRYVERDMTTPEGAFYSATDADSPDPSGRREEGWFFTWTPEEIEQVLGPERAPLITSFYNVAPGGNFEGRSILNVVRPLDVVAKDLKIPLDRAEAMLAESRELLYQARLKRPPPLRDEKVLAAWNGLMISALARASLVLGDESYAQRAVRAGDFIMANLMAGGRLMRSWKDGLARHAGYLDDYASMIGACIDLFEATSDPKWIERAIALDAVLEQRFEDREHGGYYMTADDGEKLIAREKPGYDGAEPSGNSLEAMNLLRLYQLTAKDGYRVRADRTFTAFSDTLNHSPGALSEMLLALDFRLDAAPQVVIVTPGPRKDAAPFLAEMRKVFLPNAVLAVVSESGDLKATQALVPVVEDKRASEGRVTAYICENNVCQLPTHDPDVFGKRLAKVQAF